MATANIVQTNFTAGEISPTMFGRVDVERYKNGVETMRNCLPLIQGGVKSAPMLRYVASAKYSNRICRLIRFSFSKTEANMLEFGHQYIRFFNQDRTRVLVTGTPYEISTVFSESELREVEYLGGADTIFFFHQSHRTQRLRRFANDNWVIDNAPFDPEPFDEQGIKPAVTLTLSAATVGAGRTATAGAAAFLAADIGRRIIYNGGSALITGYSSTTAVTVTIETAFASASIASSVWTLDRSPQAVLNPSARGSIGETITLTLSTGVIYGDRFTLDAATFDNVAVPPQIDFSTITDSGMNTGDTVRIEGCEPIEYNGTYEIVADSGANFSVNYAPDPGSITVFGTAQKVVTSSTVAGWRSDDVGKFISINGGLVKITGYTSTSQVSAIILQALSSDAGAQAGAWKLMSSVWNDANGYPRCGTFFQQSLVVGGSPGLPHTIAKSQTKQYLNFELGLADTDAFLYTLDATEFDPILHLDRVKDQVIALTSGSEYTLTGGVESPFTPTNAQMQNPTDYGCNDVKPVRIGNELMYFNRSGKKLRAMGYRFDNDSFSSPDMTKLSEHITGDGIIDSAYQQEPNSILWNVREDGVLATLSIDREEGVLGWAQQTTDGEFESVEVIPNTSGDDETWCVVKRTIGGSDVRYIEVYDDAVPYGLHSAISGSVGGAGQTTWTGISHLNGETVEIIADGIAIGQEVVSGGSITLNRAANEVYIGLPARAYIKTLNPDLITSAGSAQGNNMRISKCTLRLLDTVCANLNGQYFDFRRFGSELLDQAAPSFTGDVDLTSLGWGKREYNEIEQANALPFHLLAIIMKLTVNNE